MITFNCIVQTVNLTRPTIPLSFTPSEYRWQSKWDGCIIPEWCQNKHALSKLTLKSSGNLYEKCIRSFEWFKNKAISSSDVSIGAGRHHFYFIFKIKKKLFSHKSSFSAYEKKIFFHVILNLKCNEKITFFLDLDGAFFSMWQWLHR